MRKPVAVYLELLSSFAFMQGLDLANAWLVDFGTGSGSAAVAGKLIGLNVLALDSNGDCLKALAALLTAPVVENWHDACWEVLSREERTQHKDELASAMKGDSVSQVLNFEEAALALPAPEPGPHYHLGWKSSAAAAAGAAVPVAAAASAAAAATKPN
jgi:hypothetical protein